MSGLVYEPAYAPNVPHVPSGFRVAEARCTSPVPVSRPEPASEPSAVVNATEDAVYQGPAVSAIVWPVGAVVSGATAKVAVPVAPAPFVAVTVMSPSAVSAAVQEYVAL